MKETVKIGRNKDAIMKTKFAIMIYSHSYEK